MDQHILIGKNVTQVYINGDKNLLRFHIEDEPPITARVRPACCTDGYIWAIDNPARLLGIVQKVEDPDKPAHTTMHPKNLCIKYYYCDITTNLGVCEIEFLATMDRDIWHGFSAKLCWPDANEIAEEHKDRQENPEEEEHDKWKLIAPPEHDQE